MRARIRAGRRSKSIDNIEAAISIGDVLLDPARHLVEKAGKPVHLTPKQFELLHYLMMHAGRPIRHAKLLRSVWGPEYGHELDYLRTFIRQIRMKIEDDPADPTVPRHRLAHRHRFNEGVELPHPAGEPKAGGSLELRCRNPRLRIALLRPSLRSILSPKSLPKVFRTALTKSGPHRSVPTLSEKAAEGA